MKKLIFYRITEKCFQNTRKLGISSFIQEFFLYFCNLNKIVRVWKDIQSHH